MRKFTIIVMPEIFRGALRLGICDALTPAAGGLVGVVGYLHPKGDADFEIDERSVADELRLAILRETAEQLPHVRGAWYMQVGRFGSEADGTMIRVEVEAP